MTESPNWKQQFISDNASPICPQAWEAMERANSQPETFFTHPYGDDPFTAAASSKIQELFETDCEVFFVFNGTIANSLALAQICQPYSGIICHPFSHVDNDEANAPEFFSGGAKLLLVDGDDAKIDPQRIPAVMGRGHGIHTSKIKAVSVTQATEVGTVYQMDEVKQLTEIKDQHPELNLKFHMDGARFANAMVALDNVSAKEITWQAGIDVLSLGGTKNGCPGTEALVFFDKQLAAEFAWRRKQAGQLASKMRYLSAPWLGVLSDDAWLKNARHANEQATLLSTELAAVDGIELAYPVETNAVFAQLPPGMPEALLERGWQFYHFPAANAWRFMCTWCTAEAGVRALLDDVRAIANAT